LMLVSPRQDALVLDDLTMTPRGDLIGRDSTDKTFRIRDGRVTIVKDEPSIIMRSGLWAFGFIHRTAYQSVDGGDNWVPVPAPPRVKPYRAKDLDSARCSEVGCDLGAWLRLGWQAPSRTEQSKALRWARPSFMLELPLAPRLRCQDSDVVRTSHGSAEPYGLGASTIDPLRRDELDNAYVRLTTNRYARVDSASWLRAFAVLVSATPSGSRAELAFALPFDPSGRVHRLSQAMPNIEGAIAAKQRVALPVLASAPDAAAGLLLPSSNALLWVEAGRTIALAAESQLAEDQLLGAAPFGDDALLLMARRKGQLRILELSAQRPPKTRWELPAFDRKDLTVLGLDPQGGIGLIYVPAGVLPSLAEPALFLQPGALPLALAPWSTLTSAAASACRGHQGVRALVSVSPSWLSLRDHTVYSDTRTIMLAQVRWSPERVCLEAVELAREYPDYRYPPNVPFLPAVPVVARFLPTSKAARSGLERGREVHQPLACSLEVRP